MTTQPTYNVPQIPSSFPCPTDDIFSLPTKEDIVNAFNELAQIPSDIKSFLVEKKDEIEEDVAKDLKKVSDEISEFVEKFADILSPYWEKGTVRNWQKEANDAITELIQEFHLFIPTKVAELISKIVPIELKVNVLGLEIDILRIFDKAHQKELKDQIAKDVDKFFSKVADEFQGFDGEFGVTCDEWKAKMTWQYIKTKIQEFLTGGLHSVFGKLIGKFKKIWKALGLPDLVSLFTLDIGAIVENAIKSFKEKRKELKEDFLKSKGEAREKLKAELEDIDKKITETLENLDPLGVGINLRSIIGGKIDKTVISLEEEILEIKIAFEDFKQNWQKKLLFEWVDIVKKFFDAIGLGKIFSFITLTFCDILGLIGFPFAINVSNATGSVKSSVKRAVQTSTLSVTREDGTTVSFTSGQKDLNGTTDDYAIFEGNGSEDTFEIPLGNNDAENLNVFVDGEPQTSGVDYNIVGGNVVFVTAPISGNSINLIDI
tara:strand:- start:5981 stop:7444 length:1464 start_codon:yes stop_codon:yes gene_type:complete